MINQKKNKWLLIGKIASVVFSMALVVNVTKAFDFITEQGIFKNLTPSEFLQIQGGNQSEQATGAIVMQEGQRNAVTDFVPDNNNEDSLGNWDKAFKNGHVSSTLYVGNNTESTASSTFTKLAVGDRVGDFTVNGITVCLSTGQNCTGVDSSAFWTYDNSIPGWYRASSTPEKHGLGTATPAAQLEIEGDQDVVQLLVEGHSTQLTPLQRWTNNSGTEKGYFMANGNFGATGTLTITGASKFVGAIVADDALTTAGVMHSSSTFQSTGAGRFYSTLTVTGATTLTGAATLSSTLGVTGATTLSDTLAVTGASTLTGATTVTGLFTPNGGIATSTWNNTTIGLSTQAAAAFTTVLATGQLQTSSTLLVGGVLTPYKGISTSTLDGVVIGGSTQAVGNFTYVSVGTGASTTLRTSATSTFSGGLEVKKASATSTIHLGGTGTAGQGGCLALASGDGSGNLYLFVAKGTLQLATSTDSKVCY